MAMPNVDVELGYKCFNVVQDGKHINFIWTTGIALAEEQKESIHLGASQFLQMHNR
jgi:hypothetical protein